MKAYKEGVLTPADQNVSPEVLPLREERNSQQCVKIKAFHQQPEETGHNTVLEEHNHYFAANLSMDTRHKRIDFTIVLQTMHINIPNNKYQKTFTIILAYHQ